MDALNSHIPVVEGSLKKVGEHLATPVSQLDPVGIATFIADEKSATKTADADCRDAKRRVVQAKGPKPNKRKRGEPEAEHNSDSDLPDDIPDFSDL